MITDASHPVSASVLRKAALLRGRVQHEPTWFLVEGPSMWSAIPGGAEVLVANAARPRVGDIWAYCNDTGTIVVHRHRRARGRVHMFQGDNSRRPDPPVHDEQLIGRLVAVRVDGHVRDIGARERFAGWAAQTRRLLLFNAKERARSLRRRTRHRNA